METKFCWQWEEMQDGAIIASDPNGGVWEVFSDWNDDIGRRFFTVEGPGDYDFEMGFNTHRAAQDRAEEMFDENY